MSEMVDVDGRRYLRGRAFFANWCCKLHPAYARRVVGYELVDMALSNKDQQLAEKIAPESPIPSTCEVTR